MLEGISTRGKLPEQSLGEQSEEQQPQKQQEPSLQPAWDAGRRAGGSPSPRAPRCPQFTQGGDSAGGNARPAGKSPFTTCFEFCVHSRSGSELSSSLSKSAFINREKNKKGRKKKGKFQIESREATLPLEETSSCTRGSADLALGSTTEHEL